MSGDDTKSLKTLTDSDIKTEHNADRRGFLGLVAIGGAAAGAVALSGIPVRAGTSDGDSGQWSDANNCPRIPVGGNTTDADNGNIRDRAGRGRGPPRRSC